MCSTAELIALEGAHYTSGQPPSVKARGYKRAMHHRLLLTALIACQLVACDSTPPNANITALNAPPGISNLVKDRLRADLTKGSVANVAFTFPARIRIIPYDFQSGLNANDYLKNFDDLAKTLTNAPDIASEATVLPASYGESVGASFEALRALRTSTRADIYLLVSGRSQVVQDKAKGVWFFDAWANKGFYEAQTALDTLCVDAASGRFLPSLQVAAKDGPQFVQIDNNASTSLAYGLRAAVERQAFKSLATNLATRLRLERTANPAPAPAPSATPAGPQASADPTAPKPTAQPTTVPADVTIIPTPTPRPSLTTGGALLTGVLVGVVLAAALFNGRSKRSLLQADAATGEAPLAGARVYLAGADGLPIPDYPEAVTDADGRFRLAGIPTSGSFRLVAEASKGGKPVALSTLVELGAGETQAQIDAASTYVTTAVQAGLAGRTCAFDAATFNAARAKVQATFNAATPPDPSDPAAIMAAMTALSFQAPALGADILKLTTCP